MVEKHKEFVVACLQATEAPRSVVVERALPVAARLSRHRVTHAAQRRRTGRGQVEREQARPALGPRAVVVRDAVHLLGTRTTNPKARRKTNAYD